jgi:transcriptional regulator with PAS, ATPase and Fis domain
MQAKLLRVLENGEVVPVGDTRPRRVDVRVISATNRDLQGEVAQRCFREDLCYRVAAFPIRMPPLRERREDIPLLADRFLTAAAARHQKQVSGIDPAAMALLVRFDWPGNVRELQNEIERAVALARDGTMVSREHLSPKLGEAHILPSPSAAAKPGGEVAANPPSAPTSVPAGCARLAGSSKCVSSTRPCVRMTAMSPARPARSAYRA